LRFASFFLVLPNDAAGSGRREHNDWARPGILSEAASPIHKGCFVQSFEWRGGNKRRRVVSQAHSVALAIRCQRNIILLLLWQLQGMTAIDGSGVGLRSLAGHLSSFDGCKATSVSGTNEQEATSAGARNAATLATFLIFSNCVADSRAGR